MATNSTLLKSLFVLSMGWMAVANTQAGTPFKEGGNLIPGTIEAEDYDTDGVDVSYHWTNQKGQNGGGYRDDAQGIGGPNGEGDRWIGELDGGAWTVYTVTVEADGDYDLDTYYGKGNDGSSTFTLTIGDFQKTITVPGTGAWEAFTPFTTRGLHLTKGTYEMKFETNGGFNVDKFVFKSAGEISTGHGQVIPGRVEAEEFDDGGAGVAYYWKNTTAANNTDYRADANFIGNGGTGHNLGWTDDGDWANYTVTVEKTGFYKMTYNAASGGNNGGSFYFRDLENNQITRTAAYPNTGGWDDYKEFTVTNIYLTEGQQTLQWVCGGGVNIDYFDFAFLGTDPEPTAVVPGTIEAEDYDENGAVFHNADKAPGFVYRPNQTVFLEKNGDRITIGNTTGGDEGDHFAYTFTATEAGTYDVQCYVACGNDNGKFQVTIDDSYDSGVVAVPNIGWGSYDEPITLSDVKLTAGTHKMVFTVRGDCNIDRFVFSNSTPNAITTVQAPAADQRCYNLQGQRVEQPRRGLYIQNGKKYIR